MTHHTTPSLPPLPEPIEELAMEDGFNVVGLAPVYTADQMRGHYLKGYADGFEAARAVRLASPPARTVFIARKQWSTGTTAWVLKWTRDEALAAIGSNDAEIIELDLPANPCATCGQSGTDSCGEDCERASPPADAGERLTLSLTRAEIKALADFHDNEQEQADYMEAGCIGNRLRAEELRAALSAPQVTPSAQITESQLQDAAREAFSHPDDDDEREAFVAGVRWVFRVTPSAQEVGPSDAELLEFLQKTGTKHVFSLGDTWYWRKNYGQPYRKCKSLREAGRAAWAAQKGEDRHE